MTTAPFLPEIDLANFAPMARDQKRKALTGFKIARPPYSYKPVRASFGDLLNLDTELFGQLPPIRFDRVAQAIRSNSRFELEADANIKVAAGLYERHWCGRKQLFGAMTSTIGQKLTYWSPIVLNLDDRAVIPFFNPRRAHLSPEGRRFVFSMMHEQIRASNSDNQNAVLGICQFADVKSGLRTARLTFDEGTELYSFEELQSMVSETYSVWADVWADRVEEVRRRAGASGDGFGF